MKCLIFLLLIYFTLQEITGCAVTYESCKDAQPAQSTTTGIANCLRMDNAECETAYALSFDKKSCVPYYYLKKNAENWLVPCLKVNM